MDDMQNSMLSGRQNNIHDNEKNNEKNNEQNSEKNNENTGDEEQKKGKINKLNEEVYNMQKLWLPRASVPEDSARSVKKTLLKEALIFLAIVVVVVVMAVIPGKEIPVLGRVPAWGEVDLYIFILVIIVFVGVTMLILVIPKTLADIPTKADRRRQEEDEAIRKKNYVRYLRRHIEEYETGFSNYMDSRFRSVAQVLDSANMEFGDYLKESMPENELMIRLGLEDVDISGCFELQGPAGSEEKEEELLWLAREVVKKYSIINDLPSVIYLGGGQMIGIIGEGDKKKAYDIARVIIGQLEMREPKERVEIAFCYDAIKDNGEWAGYDKLALAHGAACATDEKESRDMLDRLVTRLEKHQPEDRNLILFVGDPELIAGHEIEKYIHPEEQTYGFTVIVLTDDEKKLPQETDKVVMSANDFTGLYRPETGERAYIRFDEVTQDMLQKVDEYMN